ncbi:related to cell wall protein cwl1 [Cephalotrichum gorgonifer]|uniref:Reticulon-like protein n=1 Tax=Cephalotrichum gorgonifer TaxID=2041049 RepID=A0AAE8SSH0_9PEZI|nr:related to cell wall protein cwl1 [Cephalotrichum gorgonifer]
MADIKTANGGIPSRKGNGSIADGPHRTATPSTTSNDTLTHYHSYFLSLLSWKDPRASGIAYTTIVSLILAARYLDIIRWGFKFTWMALGATVAAEVAGKVLLNNGLTSQLRPRTYYKVSRDTVDNLIGDVHELVNFFVIEGQRILFAENVYASAAAFVAAFISYYLVKVVPYWALAILGTTVAFVVPLVYTSNQELIDEQLKNAADIVSAQTAQLRSTAAQHTQQVAGLTKQYMGDYSAKAQNVLRGRSASPEVQQKTFPSAPTHQPSAASDIKEADFPSAPTGSVEETKEKVVDGAAAEGAAPAPAEAHAEESLI